MTCWYITKNTMHISYWVYYSIYCKYLDNICQQSTLLSQNIVRLYKYISQMVTFTIVSRWFENKKQQFFKINVKMSLISSYSAAWMSWPKSTLTRLQIFHLFLFHKKYCDWLSMEYGQNNFWIECCDLKQNFKQMLINVCKQDWWWFRFLKLSLMMKELCLS